MTEYESDYDGIKAAINAGERITALAGQPKAFDLPTDRSSLPYAVVPDGMHLEPLEKFIPPAPLRLEASPEFTNVASFIGYVHRYKEPNTLIFAGVAREQIVAVIDYHGSEQQPAWCCHRATLHLQHSPEWKAWRSKNRATLTQLELGEWLEDNLPDIVEPDGAAIMEAVLNLSARRTIAFKSARNLANGTAQLLYSDEEQRGGEMVIPTKFTLGLRYYQGQRPNQITVRLRYKLRDGDIAFAYLIDRLEQVAEKAFDDVTAQIAVETGLPVLAGTP